MKTIKKETKDQNLTKDNVCYLPINKTENLEIRATFAFHVFLEEICNEAANLQNENKKPLSYFVERTMQNNFTMPVQELLYIVQNITARWFGLTADRIEIINHNDINARLIYLIGLCHGGGKFAKKLLALRAIYQRTALPQIPKAIKKKESMSINGNTLH